MNPTNLNQLKNYLQIGMSLTLIDTSMKDHKYLNQTRKIAIKQTNAIKFVGGSWLYFGKAKDYTFKDNQFTNTWDKGTAFSGFLTYEFIS